MARSVDELAARLAASPIYDLLGVAIVAAGDGEVHMELACDRRHANVDGVVHGGLLAFVADTAMGLAIRTQIVPGWHIKTLDLSIEFVRGARQDDRLAVVARVDESSRRFRWASARLEAGGALVARARSLNLVAAPR